ncbi:MAG: mechanosensitive ion channel [Deltaproteobacteria bacterium]|jgi:potassium-dependent mechanosensitive channel|nr:mechanosensitive ion channel [Deltaproteobacteria bacterium]
MKKFIILSIIATILSIQTAGYCQGTAPLGLNITPKATDVEHQDAKPIAAKKQVVGPTKSTINYIGKLKEAEKVKTLADKEEWPLAMRDLADQNVDVIQKIISISEKYELAKKANTTLEERLHLIRGNFDKTKERVESMGLTPAVAALLQKRRLALIKLELPKSSAVQRRAEIRRVNEDELRLEGMEEFVDNLNVDTIAAHIDVMDLQPADKASTTKMMQKALSEGQRFIDDLRAANAQYLTILGDQSYAERAIKLEARKSIDFINVNLLWARSNQSFGVEDTSFIGQALLRFFDPVKWSGLSNDIANSLRRDWFQWGLVLLIFIGWIIFRVRRNSFLKAMSRKLEESKSTSMLATLKGLVMAVLVAGLFPLFIAVGASLLSHVPGCHEFTKSITLSLYTFANILFIAGLARTILRPSGLGQIHFEWPELTCRPFRKFAWWCMVLIAPLIFLLLLINNGFSVPVRGSLGRMIFILEMILLAIILIPITKPGSAIFSYLSNCSSNLLLKTRKIWLPLAIVIPASLIAIAFLGYYRTGFLLSVDFISTIAFLGILIFIKAFLNRWTNVATHKLNLGDRDESEEKTNRQTSMLISLAMAIITFVGLYRIWSNDIPIIEFLNHIVLWTYQAGIDVTQSPIIKSTTLGHFLMCIVILAATYLVAKNLFGFLNIVFFKRLKVNPGTQHATTLIIKYIITVIGATLALDSIGIGWSKFQWLVAALTVGLGFGLQEIVANFVSGIIILFERPISIGDTIAVGGVEGKVTKIQIRATTITDWDNKEVLVPNKSLLTTNITNWTLSDQVVRIVIPIGIAYGSDARKAEEVLLKVAKDNELTLNEPSTSVIFVGFGDNSLDFKLRTYAQSSNRMTAINKLHLEINDAFNSAGLEIPFPQRDVHIDMLKPLDVNIVK